MRRLCSRSWQVVAPAFCRRHLHPAAARAPSGEGADASSASSAPAAFARKRHRGSGGDAESLIRDVVHRPGNHEALYLALRRHAEALSPANAVTALSSLAHLDARRGPVVPPTSSPTTEDRSLSARSAENILAAHLAALLRDQGAVWSPRVTANLMWAIAKLEQRAPFDVLVPQACELLLAESRAFNGRDLAIVLWSLAVLDLGSRRDEVVSVIAAALRAKADARELSVHDIAQSLWASATLDEAKTPGLHPLVLSLVRAAHGRAHEFKTHSLSVSLWALGLLDALHGVAEVQLVVGELARAAAALARDMNPQMLSNCGWGAARAGLPPGPFYDTIAPVATSHLRSGPPALTDQHVCNVAWAFAHAEVRSPQVLSHMQAVSEKLCQQGALAAMQSHHASGTTWALLKLFTPDQQSLQRQVELPQSVRATVAAAAAVALENSGTWRPRDLARVCWSVARAFAQDQALALLPPVVERLAAMPAKDLVMADFTMVTWAVAATEMSRAHFRPDALEALMGRALLTFRAQGPRAALQESYWSNTVWACARADFHGSAHALFEAVAAVAAASLASERPWSIRHLTMVAWALVMHSRYTPATVPFIREVYARALRSHHDEGAAAVDELQPQLEQLSLIRVALGCEPRLRPSAVGQQGSAVEGIGGAVRSAEASTALETTESWLQVEVGRTLRDMGFGPSMRAEVIVSGGMSVDMAMLPLPNLTVAQRSRI